MKKSLIMALCLAICAALAIGGTLAYMTDETKVDVNVYTAGSIDIEQVELMTNNSKTGFEEFVHNKGLYPTITKGDETYDVTGSFDGKQYTAEGLWAPETIPGVLDKIVFVNNVGMSDAYFRTVFAFEGDAELMKKVIINKNEADYDWQTLGEMSITHEGDTAVYTIMVATYKKALLANETAPASLKQVYMHAAATNGDMETIGAQYKIMVATQAAQTNYLVDEAKYDDAVKMITDALNLAFYTTDYETNTHGVLDINNNPFVDPNFDEIKDPTADADLVIEDLDDFLAFANAVNGNANSRAAGDTFKGKTVVLNSDVNLAGIDWTPIGSQSNQFQGTFDGQGHTISNLTVDKADMSNVGLFGFTTNGHIKNVKVHNAKVKGYLNVGVIAGTPYTSKYSNIEITGLVQVDGFAYVGGALGKNVYADITNITIMADEGSYVKANSVDEDGSYRTYVGGVIGFMGEGSHTVSNVTSNIDVTGSTCDVGGISGIAHYGNSFINCHSSGDVTITDFDEEDAEAAMEIGGIAGVWHNQTGYQVKVQGCSYSGTLYTNIYGNDPDGVQAGLGVWAVNSADHPSLFPYGGVVGKAYSSTGKGELVIGD